MFHEDVAICRIALAFEQASRWMDKHLSLTV